MHVRPSAETFHFVASGSVGTVVVGTRVVVDADTSFMSVANFDVELDESASREFTPIRSSEKPAMKTQDNIFLQF